jgi:hypothetical protein
LKPVFHYLKKITLTASKLTKADVDIVTAAGWSEDALHEVILVGCLPDVVFTDPAFGTLKGDRASAMWRMLLSRKETNPTITFSEG